MRESRPERETDRQAVKSASQTNRQTDKPDRQTSQPGRQTYLHTDRQTHTYRRHTARQTNTQTRGRTDSKTDRQAGRQTDRQIDNRKSEFPFLRGPNWHWGICTMPTSKYVPDCRVLKASA